MSDLYDEIQRMWLEQALADARDVLDSEIAEDIEMRHAALEELRAMCAEMERRLKQPERTN